MGTGETDFSAFGVCKGGCGGRDGGVCRCCDMLFQTKDALLMQVLQERGVQLWDFKRILEECLPFVAFVSSQSGHFVAVHQYYQFLDSRSGLFAFSTSGLRQTKDSLQEKLVQLDGFVSSGVYQELSSAFMSDIQVEALNNAVIEEVYSSYCSSAYGPVDIDMRLSSWVVICRTNLLNRLGIVEKNLSLSNEEARQLYGVSDNDRVTVSRLFREYSDTSLSDALVGVVSGLVTDGQKRAYLGALSNLLIPYYSQVDLRNYWSYYLMQ